jgi:hypothetical protein
MEQGREADTLPSGDVKLAGTLTIVLELQTPSRSEKPFVFRMRRRTIGVMGVIGK